MNNKTYCIVQAINGGEYYTQTFILAEIYRKICPKIYEFNKTVTLVLENECFIYEAKRINEDIPEDLLNKFRIENNLD